MALGISSFDSIANSGNIAGGNDGGQEIASNFGLGSIFSNFGFGGLFSGPVNKSGEGSGTVACIFGDNLSLDSNGNGAGGEVLFGGFSGGGGSCGGGSVSLA
ncbi:MAG: hypothetical protein PHE78_01385 [Candidatus Gastranaerophilales bacterium]|jgi:hypothetical protein|nr:hypothetical protein [Candidatus Gastranaerophilales bacterium]